MSHRGSCRGSYHGACYGSRAVDSHGKCHAAPRHVMACHDNSRQSPWQKAACHGTPVSCHGHCLGTALDKVKCQAMYTPIPNISPRPFPLLPLAIVLLLRKSDTISFDVGWWRCSCRHHSFSAAALLMSLKHYFHPKYVGLFQTCPYITSFHEAPRTAVEVVVVLLTF